MALPEINPALLGRTPSGQRYIDFIANVFEEVAEKPYAGKHIRGPRYTEFAESLAGMTSLLKMIDPRLSETALHASSYRDRGVDGVIESLDLDAYIAFNELYSHKWYVLSELAKLHTDEDLKVQIPEGLFTTPKYLRQRDSQRCVNACFRMVYEGLTEATLNENEVHQAIRSVYGKTHIDDEEYLKIFRAEGLLNEYGVRAQTIAFTGMDLESISKIASSVRSRNDSYKNYCIVTLRTETSTDKNVWHSVALLAVTDRHVMCHDPAADTKVGKPFKAIPKKEFMSRWASAYNRGYLVIAG